MTQTSTPRRGSHWGPGVPGARERVLTAMLHRRTNDLTFRILCDVRIGNTLITLDAAVQRIIIVEALTHLSNLLIRQTLSLPID